MNLQRLPFTLPTDQEKAVISKDVQVSSDKLKNGIILFKEWLQCENYLPTDVDETLIRNFVYGCKGNLETAKSKFEKYMVNRTKLTMLYKERQGDRNAIYPIHRFIWTSPRLTPQGYRVFFFRLPISDTTHFNCIECYKRVLLQIDLLLFADENAGYKFIIDAKNVSMAFLSKLNLTLTHHIFQIIYTIVPFRIKKIYFINTTPALDILLEMFLKIISKKLKERIRHVKTEELTMYVLPEYLPNEYGGSGGEYNVIADQCDAFLMENLKWIKDTEDLKLTGPIPDSKKMFYSFEESCMDGSFRKLNID